MPASRSRRRHRAGASRPVCRRRHRARSDVGSIQKMCDRLLATVERRRRASRRGHWQVARRRDQTVGR
jgi:hypothetical protein